MCGIGAVLDACEVCGCRWCVGGEGCMCGIGACWMPVTSGACGKKYSAGGVCML